MALAGQQIVYIQRSISCGQSHVQYLALSSLDVPWSLNLWPLNIHTFLLTRLNHAWILNTSGAGPLHTHTNCHMYGGHCMSISHKTTMVMKTCPPCMFDESEDRKSYENHVIDLGKMAFWRHEWRQNPLMGTQNVGIISFLSFILYNLYLNIW